jgi:hypothetical protein
MKAVATALSLPRPLATPKSQSLLSFSAPNEVKAPGAPARAPAAECRGRLAGRRKEPA